MPHESGSTRPGTSDRRSAPRLQLVAPLAGHDDRGRDVTLINISEGGLLVYTAQPALAGEVRHFQFQIEGDPFPTHFSARVVHVLRISEPDTAKYAVGLEFVTALPEQARRALERLATVAPPPTQ